MKLHLVLKYCWYDKIEKGEKTVEYRRLCTYWINRILGKWQQSKNRTVVFHRGYTNVTMEFKARAVLVDVVNDRIQIHLGERVDKGGV